MPDEQKKSNNNHSFYFAIVIVLFLATACFYLRGCGNETGSNDYSTATVDRIKESAETTAGNIADIERGNYNAEKAIQRADAELERSQAAAEDSAKRINRIEQLVKECIDGNRKTLGIMQRIEAANTTGKEKSQP